MSTETLAPLSSTPERSQDIDFFEGVLEAQADQHLKPKRNREAKPTVESIEPRRVPVVGTIDLEHVLLAREAIAGHYADPEEFPADESVLLEELSAGLDPDSPAYDRQVHELNSLLTAPDKQFAKKSRQYELYQARRDGVKLVRPKAEKTEQGSARLMPKTVERLMDAASERKNRVTEKGLRRDIKSVDRHFNGLVGEIAETGTKASYLEKKYGEFNDQMEAHGANVNDKTRHSIERETLRKLIDAESLADRQGLEGDERREYIDGLVEVFHDYVTLSDSERERFNETLSARNNAAKLLTSMERENAAAIDDGNEEKEPRESRRTRLIRSLGSAAASVVAASRNRWEARMAAGRDHSEDAQPALFEDKPYRKKGKLASAAQSVANKPNELYHNANARLVESRIRRQEKLAAMSDEEREAYESKNRRNRKAILAVGGAALAITVAAYAAKYGIDRWGNDNQGLSGPGEIPGMDQHDGFRDMDRDGVPDSIDSDRGYGESIREPGTDGSTPTDAGATERLGRHELFDGRGGTRTLTSANIAELRDFLSDYKVKESDNDGIWGISRKYLHSQGISNPTIFEVDAVKDYILQNSSLTNSSIIHPDDTIKLK